jgi:RNA polymerase sigma factor (TIGR02999 family)
MSDPAQSADANRILDVIQQGDRRAAADLLPLVYQELRELARRRLAREAPGQTLQATALVHEAYLRLVGPKDGPKWADRGHFLCAAAEAMRRILIENARRRKAEKHGGDRGRIELSDAIACKGSKDDELLLLDDALSVLGREDAVAADVAKLRLFAGLSAEEAGDALGISRATAFRHWTYARAWLQAELGPQER